MPVKPLSKEAVEKQTNIMGGDLRKLMLANRLYVSALGHYMKDGEKLGIELEGKEYVVIKQGDKIGTYECENLMKALEKK